jgi:hypothetical protein
MSTVVDASALRAKQAQAIVNQARLAANQRRAFDALYAETVAVLTQAGCDAVLAQKIATAALAEALAAANRAATPVIAAAVRFIDQEVVDDHLL